MTVLFDTNVLIDISDHREPFYEKSLAAFTLAVNGVITGLVGAITDIYYIIRKSRQSKEQALQSVIMIANILNLADTTGAAIKTALASDFPDFEDAVLSATAGREKADYIITRNSNDFTNSPVKALSPEEFVEILMESRRPPAPAGRYPPEELALKP
jgi:predicted nucleic acid-binding protein